MPLPEGRDRGDDGGPRRGEPPAAPGPEAVAAAFADQARLCDGFRAPLYAELCRRCADDVRSGGPVAELTRGWVGDPRRGALPLRVLGGVHALVLAGEATELAVHFPSVGGSPRWPDAWRAFLTTVRARLDAIRPWLLHAPQTNEVGRSGSLLGGFLAAAAAGLPLRLLELGSSAGLNLRFDHYRITLGERSWGPVDAGVALRPRWSGRTPSAAPLRVASRAGCDLAPLDLADPAAGLRLQAYVWPDRTDRLATLRAALAVARDVPVALERADAVEWLEPRLALPTPGVATVVFHSSFHGYLPVDSQQRLAGLLHAAGARASRAAPLCWLRCEDEVPLPTDRPMQHELRLWCWPGDTDLLLARCQPHGDQVEWLATA